MQGMKSLDDNSIDLTLTDIPYDGVNNVKNSDRGIRILNKGNADVLKFDLQKFLSEVFRITKGTIIIFCEIGQVSEIYNYYRNAGATVRHLVWEKTNPLPLNGERFIYPGLNAQYTPESQMQHLMPFVKTQYFIIRPGPAKSTRQKKTIDCWKN